MKNDEIEIEILDDGRVKVTTGKIGPANHINADQFVGTIQSLMGGPVERKKNPLSRIYNAVKDKLKQ